MGRHDARVHRSLFPEFERNDVQAKQSAGLLPCQDIEELVRIGAVDADSPISPDQIQPASMDLRLGDVAYRVQASFLPGRKRTVASMLQSLQMHRMDLSGPAVLEKGCVYIIPLTERLRLATNISAKANPKSTTGRLDVFTRLITDYAAEFEAVRAGYRGRLYVEVVPRTFSIIVQRGAKLNQLRFIRGGPRSSDALLDRLDRQETLVYLDGDIPGEAVISGGLWISMDLMSGSKGAVVGFRAKACAPAIDLSKVGYYSPADYWEFISRPKSGSIVLEPDDFYILKSKERIRVPPQFAAAMVPYDQSVGEFRVHYAGFFDPGFGYGNNDIKGTYAVLEVRSHEVPFRLEDGQIVGRLMYEKLLAAPKKVYGAAIGSSYQSQGLALSRQFGPHVIRC